MNLHISASTPADGGITYKWTDTDFNYSGITGGQFYFGGVLTGSGSSSYGAYFDNSNAQFGTGVTVASLGPYGVGGFGGNASGPGPTASSFSMTIAANATLAANSTLGNDLTFVALPTPLTLSCGAAAGQVGAPYNSSLIPVGGIPPYTFSITAGALPSGLTLNPSTGAITGIPTQPGTASFTAQVVDSVNSIGNAASTSCSIVVTQPPPLSVFCPISTGQVGVPYSSAIAASGGVPPYTYSISAGVLPDGLSLNPFTGVITGTPTIAGPFTFTAQVVDSRGSLAGTATSNCGITIAPPPLTAACVSATAGQVGIPYTSAITSTGGTAPYTYALASGSLPGGLTLNPSTGLISGTPTTAGAFSFAVKVTDSTSGTALTFTTPNCGITIAPPPLTAACVSATAGQVGIPYTSAITSTGGTAPYTYALASGSLPGGLTLNPSTGLISGTPTTAGAFSFAVKVTDSTSGTALTFTTPNCGITIAPPPSKLDLDCATCSSILGFVGKEYNATLNVSGGIPPYTFSIVSGSLPHGVVLNATTGEISGTPTAPGLFIFTTKVVDSAGNSATATCLLIILKSPVTLTCGACESKLGSGQVGIAYTEILAVIGGTAPYTFSLVSGALPPGLTLNSSTGKVIGTPTVAGTFSFTVKVVDARGYSGTATCTIVIKVPIDLTCGSCTSTATGKVGVAYADTLSVIGGVAPFTFSIASGSLPPGLTLSSSAGKVAGIPTTAGTYTFTVKVVDSRGNSDTATCTIVIKTNPIDLQCGTCESSATAIVGVSFTDTLTVQYGVAPYTFSVISGSLPPGLTLNSSTGKVSGTPTASGTYTFMAKAVDARGSSDTAVCTIKVVVAPLDLTCGTCGGAAGIAWVGTPYTDTLEAKGGVGSYGFSLVSGSLPPGLTLSTSGKIFGTPTKTGTYGFTVKVMDAQGHTDTATCALVVKASSIDLNCGACDGYGKGKIGSYYSDQLTVTNGTAPYTFSLISGSLPPGLSLNTSTGKISGTPTKTGTYTFTVKVVDARSFTDTVSCTVLINWY